MNLEFPSPNGKRRFTPLPLLEGISEEDTAAYMVPELSRRRGVYRWIDENFPLGEDDNKSRRLIRRGRRFVYLMRVCHFKSPCALLFFFKAASFDQSESQFELWADELRKGVSKVDSKLSPASVSARDLAKIANIVSRSSVYTSFFDKLPALEEYVDRFLKLFD